MGANTTRDFPVRGLRRADVGEGGGLERDRDGTAGPEICGSFRQG
jgi:hypothetical protein